MSLFKSHEKPTQTLVGLYPCLSGDDVINNCGKTLALQIRDLVSATKEIYQDLYLSTLYRFAEFCQSMPLHQNSEVHSLLKQQLTLVTASLKLRQGLLLPHNSGAETMANEDAQWTYAIFSASLLYQLHYIQSDRQITLHNAQGEKRGSWHPLMGSLYEPNVYFSIQWQSPAAMVSPESLMASIVSRIISPHILRWLSQNPALLIRWWAAVTSEAGHEKNNPIWNIIDKAAEAVGYQTNKMSSMKANEMLEESKQRENEIQDHHFSQPFTNPLTELLGYLDNIQNTNSSDITWLRVKDGLFVCLSVLQVYATAHCDGKMQAEFIDVIKSSLVSEKNQFIFRYRPRVYEDRRIVEGIIIQEEQLSERWQQQPVNEEFQPTLS